MAASKNTVNSINGGNSQKVKWRQVKNDDRNPLWTFIFSSDLHSAQEKVAEKEQETTQRSTKADASQDKDAGGTDLKNQGTPKSQVSSMNSSDSISGSNGNSGAHTGFLRLKDRQMVSVGD